MKDSNNENQKTLKKELKICKKMDRAFLFMDG
jgi:hypothetical protein